MRLLAQFHAALFHMLFFYQQPGSIIMLRLAAHTVHYHVINNRFVKRITTRRVTSGGVQLTSFAPSQHSFEVHKHRSDCDTVSALTGPGSEPQTARTDSDVVTN